VITRQKDVTSVFGTFHSQYDRVSDMKTNCTKFFPYKSISRTFFSIDNLATGPFSEKFLPKIAGSGHAGSNDTSLKSVSRPGAEPIECQSNR
jgi:hypothetical protein